MISNRSVIKSPSGVVFKITSCCFVEAYITVVGGELQTNIYPLPAIDDEFTLDEETTSKAANKGVKLDAQRTIEQEIVHVTTGTLLLLSVGWDVAILAGVIRCPGMCYIDFPILPPLHACVKKDITSKD